LSVSRHRALAKSIGSPCHNYYPQRGSDDGRHSRKHPRKFQNWNKRTSAQTFREVWRLGFKVGGKHKTTWLATGKFFWRQKCLSDVLHCHRIPSKSHEKRKTNEPSDGSHHFSSSPRAQPQALAFRLTYEPHPFSNRASPTSWPLRLLPYKEEEADESSRRFPFLA
jgi:hypothetical protein